jgi:AraC-like DNA-binding protein
VATLAFHPHAEIQLLRHGRGRMLIGGHRYAFRPRSLLIIPPNMPHRFEPASDVPCEKWVVMFRPSAVREGPRDFRFPRGLPHHVVLDEPSALEMEMAFRILRAEQERPQAYQAECAAGTLRSLMALVKRAARCAPAPPPSHPIVTSVVDCIEKGFREALSLTSLAAKAGYSPYYLAHLFRRCTGMTPKQYVLQRRVAEARRLLAEHHALTVEAVAGLAGFSSYRVLCRGFRKLAGMNPAEYRRTARWPESE